MTVTAPEKTAVVPFSLKDAPSLIEKAWPTAKISAETQKERKANPHCTRCILERSQTPNSDTCLRSSVAIAGDGGSGTGR